MWAYLVEALVGIPVVAVVTEAHGVRRGVRLAGLQKNKYNCACNHSIVSHEDKSDGIRENSHAGKCTAGFYRNTSMGNGNNKDMWIRCSCTGYVGDRPLELMQREYPNG